MPDPGGYRGKRTPAKSKTSSAARGLGYEHRRNRERMLRNHIDGRPCRCGVGADGGPGCICRRAGYALSCTAIRTSIPTACPSRGTTGSVAVEGA
jgi:hypothetical protein